MTRDERPLEERLAVWLQHEAPAPAPDLADRILRQTAVTDQRRRPAWFAFALSGAAAAAVVAVAVVIGLQLARLPDRSIGGPSPSAAPTSPVTSDAPGATPEPAPSQTTAPSTSRILFSGALDGPTADIYAVEPDGSDLQRLTDDGETHETDASWSPDGTRIAYNVVTDDGSMEGGTWVMDADGSGKVALTQTFPYGAPRWSPDATTVATGGNGEQGTGITLHDPAGGGATPLTTDGGVGPVWSPDGGSIAYAVRGDVRVVAIGTGEGVTLTEGPAADTVLAWTPDGASVILVRDGAEALIVPAGGGQPTPFEFGVPFAFSPDGRWVAHVTDGGLRLTQLDGQVDVLVHPRPADTAPSWTADSSRFVFAVQAEAGTRDIYLMNVDAEEPAPVATSPADEGSPAWR